LLEQLRILLNESCQLEALLGILSALLRNLFPQRFQLVHRRVQIILADLCRSSFLLFRAEAADTNRAVRR